MQLVARGFLRMVFVSPLPIVMAIGSASETSAPPSPRAVEIGLTAAPARMNLCAENLTLALELQFDEKMWRVVSRMEYRGHLPAPATPGVPTLNLGQDGIYSISNSAPEPNADVEQYSCSFGLLHWPSQTEVTLIVSKVNGVLDSMFLVHNKHSFEVTNSEFLETLEAMGADAEAAAQDQFIAALGQTVHPEEGE